MEKCRARTQRGAVLGMRAPHETDIFNSYERRRGILLQEVHQLEQSLVKCHPLYWARIFTKDMAPSTYTRKTLGFLYILLKYIVVTCSIK
jgi:hypothetical protein